MSTTKLIAITLLLLTAFGLINFIRGNAQYPIAQIIPFCSGKVTVHDLGGLAMIIITLAGIQRLKRTREEEPTAPSTGELKWSEQPRWYLLAVPATVLVVAYLARGLAPSMDWETIAAGAGSEDAIAYGRLASLGIVLITAVVLYKWLRSN